MTTYTVTVQFEVPDDVPADGVHEDLCLVLHEGAVSTVAYSDIKLANTGPPSVYIQDADGNERTLPITEPDPADGTFCAHMDDEGQSWIRIVPN